MTFKKVMWTAVETTRIYLLNFDRMAERERETYFVLIYEKYDVIKPIRTSILRDVYNGQK